MPTLLTLPPSRFLLRLVSIDLLALTLALWMGVVLHGNPNAYTGEGEPVTWLSFAHLLASHELAGVVFRLRTHGRPPLCGWRDPRWLWLLLAFDFLFLAVDEVPGCTSRSTARCTGFSDCRRLRFPTVSTT